MEPFFTFTRFPGIFYQAPKKFKASKAATTIAAFGSASARAVTVPPAVFTTGIDDVILAKSFKLDVGTIKKFKAGLTTGFLINGFDDFLSVCAKFDLIAFGLLYPVV
ncbi:hypothetical protein L3X38_012557 [Prunus dulcis]|uniref:Uncharacterized protein n=1 Tax=Prunus dulcis TaxID=3755 RepID=A0AAD4ZG54_PRUDU|nr:hypothetical protein L3X38_012557 [Prunus dulcis]